MSIVSLLVDLINWEEVIDIFHVTCLPKHAQACPYQTKIALSPILLLNNVYFLVLNLFSSVSFIIQRKPHVLENSGSHEIGSQPIRLLHLMNLLNRYVHIFHGGRPNWEEVIDIFHIVTWLMPKHTQACPYRTIIALSSI